jgi:hypothetical protein
VRGRVGERERGRERQMGSRILHFRELETYQMAMDAAMRIFELSKGFPAEERISVVPAAQLLLTSAP